MRYFAGPRGTLWIEYCNRNKLRNGIGYDNEHLARNKKGTVKGTYPWSNLRRDDGEPDRYLKMTEEEISAFVGDDKNISEKERSQCYDGHEVSVGRTENIVHCLNCGNPTCPSHRRNVKTYGREAMFCIKCFNCLDALLVASLSSSMSGYHDYWSRRCDICKKSGEQASLHIYPKTRKSCEGNICISCLKERLRAAFMRIGMSPESIGAITS